MSPAWADRVTPARSFRSRTPGAAGRPLTKSEFLAWRSCPQSAWLARHDPGSLPDAVPSAFHRMLAADGYAVEREVASLVEGWPDAAACGFQVVFDADRLHARVDMVRRRPDGVLDLYEIKLSSAPKAAQLVDLAFQRLVAERTGARVGRCVLVHVDPDYVRRGPVRPDGLLLLTDVTAQVDGLRAEVAGQADAALAMLSDTTMDAPGCACRHYGDATRRCLGFALLNPDIVGDTAHLLPRISAAKLKALDERGSLAITDVGEGDVTAAQLPTLRVLRSGEPLLDRVAIREFVASVAYPAAFYDYETFASAVPIADELSPHAQIPVQFSLHVLEAGGALRHHEFLAMEPGRHAELVDRLADAMPGEGSVIAWNASYEKGCNVRLGRLLPDRAAFLSGIDDRTLDLMVPFRSAWIDPAFRGSASIKRVLPALCPDLVYADDAVHDGAGAMEAWLEMATSRNSARRDELRSQLLAYCRLDSLAMVRLFQCLLGAAG